MCVIYHLEFIKVDHYERKREPAREGVFCRAFEVRVEYSSPIEWQSIVLFVHRDRSLDLCVSNHLASLVGYLEPERPVVEELSAVLFVRRHGARESDEGRTLRFSSS